MLIARAIKARTPKNVKASPVQNTATTASIAVIIHSITAVKTAVIAEITEAVTFFYPLIYYLL